MTRVLGGNEIRGFQRLACAGAQIAHVADWSRYDLQPTMRLNHYNPRLEAETEEPLARVSGIRFLEAANRGHYPGHPARQ